MIRFIDSIENKDPEEYMKKKVDEFWLLVNPYKKNGDNHEYSICNRASKLQNEYKQGLHFNKTAKSCKITQKRHVKYLKYLTKNNHKNIKGIITCKPEELENYISEALEILEESDLYKLENNNYKSIGFGKLLSEKIFTYSSFRKNDKTIMFYKNLGIDRKHCLYCGDTKLNIIYNVKDKSSNKILFDLDHFYLNSKYPFLSLSFYNLIPCCGLCNSRFRSTKSFQISSHINPFLDSFDEHYSFLFDKYELTSVLASFKKIETMDLIIKSKSARKNDLTSLHLGLKERYSEQLEALDMIAKTISYNSQKTYSEIITELRGLNNHIIPKDRKKILDASMAKFKMDFLEQFENIMGNK